MSEYGSHPKGLYEIEVVGFQGFIQLPMLYPEIMKLLSHQQPTPRNIYT